MIPDSLFYQNTRIVDVGEAGMLPGAIQSTRNAAFLERLWHALPNERDRLRPYVEKAKAYRNECGCVTGVGSSSARWCC